jgi:hypothetical protein
MIARMNNGMLLSHARRGVFVREGRARSDRLDINGPECSPGGGIKGRIVCATMGCRRENRELVKSRNSLLCCCWRRNGCRVDIDDAERYGSVFREGANSRVRDLMASRSDVLVYPELLEVGRRVGGRGFLFESRAETRDGVQVRCL